MKGKGGRGGGNVAQDLIRDNMQDLGIDSYNMEQDQVPPELYPSLNTRPTNPGPISQDDLYCIRKAQELSKRFRASSYYLSRKEDHGDIKRYSDKYKGSSGTLTSVADCINAVCSEKESYFPLELLEGVYGKKAPSTRDGGSSSSDDKNDVQSSATSGSSSNRGTGNMAGIKRSDQNGNRNHDANEIQRQRSNSHTAYTLENLARKERSVQGNDAEKGVLQGGEGSDGSGNEHDGEEENDDDYMKDHNESDDGGDDGGDDDGEPSY